MRRRRAREKETEMKNAIARSVTALVLLAPISPAFAWQEPAAELTLEELGARRDLWPPRVTVKRAFELSGGTSIRAGQELVLHELTGTDAVLDTGRILFRCPVQDTDVLERARALVARLSPAQLALSWKELVLRSELWPVRVSLENDVVFQNGRRYVAGTEVALRGFQAGAVDLYAHEGAMQFTLEPRETDVLARARERLELPEEQREPFFVRAVAAALEHAKPGKAAGALPGSELILVYRGRKACPRCAAFTPELAEFCERVKSGTDGFELVFLSSDATAEEASLHRREAALPGRAVAFDRRVQVARLAALDGDLLPLVYVFDRSGNLIERNHPNGGSPTALDVLTDLEKRLKELSSERK